MYTGGGGTDGGGGGGGQRTKYYVVDGKVSIATESLQILDAQGKLRTVEFQQHTKEQITTLFTDVKAFQKAWTDPKEREVILSELESRGVSVEQVAEIMKLADLDPFDVLCYVAFDLQPLTRRQRAEKVKKAAIFATYSENAKEIISLILEKYVQFGANQLNSNILAVKPISEKGNLMEIASIFGGAPNLLKALDNIQQLLYAEAA